MNSTSSRIALTDDHELIRVGIAGILERAGYNVVIHASNGKELISQLETTPVDLVLMDISMPEMDGIKTTEWLKRKSPDLKVIALSVFDDDMNIIRMLRAGARGYLVKNSPKEELIAAIQNVIEKGFHFSDLVSNRLYQSLHDDIRVTETAALLNEREVTFLKHCCSELTYKEIGDLMNVSPRTAEGYGKAMCEKLGAKSRVGLVLYALKNGLVKY